MEELRVSDFSAHRLRRRLAEKGRLPLERSPISPLPPKQKLPDSLPAPPAPPIPLPPASLPDLSPPSTPSPQCPAIHADPDSASAASPTSGPPPPPPPPPPLPRPPYYRRFSYTSSSTQTAQATSPEYTKQRNESSPEAPGQERLLPEELPEENAQQNSDEGTKQKEAETPEVPKATTAMGVSLNEHVQKEDGGREDTMRSFILERFLPAAKVVAADHESSISAASRNRVLPPSAASKPEPIQKAPSRHAMNSRAQMPSNARRGLTWSSPLHSKQTEKGSPHHRHDSMSCGFLCLGIKTALSHAHRTVFTSARSVPRSKSRAPPPSSRVTISRGDNHASSSDEEDGVIPKIKASVQGTWKQRSALIPPSISYSSTSPTTATFRSSSPRYAASLRDSFPRGSSTSLCGSPSQSVVTSSGSTPLHIQSGSWNLRGSPLQYQTRRPTLKHSPIHDDVGGTSWEGTLHEQVAGTGLGGTPPHDNGNPNDLRGTSARDHAIGTPLHDQAGGTSWEGTLHEQAAGTGLGGTPPHDKGNPNNLRAPLHDQACRTSLRGTPPHDQAGGTSLRGTSLHDLAGRIIINSTCLQEEAGRRSSKGSPAHDYAVALPLRDQDSIEDDEPQFYDALSRFNSMESTPGSLTPDTIGSPKSKYEASGFPSDWTNDKAGFIDASIQFETPSETPQASTSDYKSLGSAASHGRDGRQSEISMGVKTSILSQRVGKVLRLETGGEQAGMEDKDSVIYHLSHEQGASPDPVHVKEPQQQHEQQQLHLRKESFSRIMSRPSLENMNGVCSSNTSLVPPIFPAKCQKSTPTSSHKKQVSANDLGWPFGISSYHSGIQRRSFQGQQRSNDRSVPGLNVPSPPLSSYHSGTQRRSFQGQQRSNDRSVPGLDVPSPPLPHSPAGSWLEKAISMNASKPSTLGILQQKGKTASARKKLESTSPDAKKEVRWEDMVKGSQMQPGHVRFSEELHHHHPSNLNAMKSLRL